MAGQPKPAFYVVVGLVVVGLVAYSIYRFSPKPSANPKTKEDIKPLVVGTPGAEKGPEVDPGVTQVADLTEKEYQIVPQDRLPPVKGTSAYRPLEKTNNRNCSSSCGARCRRACSLSRTQSRRRSFSATASIFSVTPRGRSCGRWRSRRPIARPGRCCASRGSRKSSTTSAT